MNQHSCNKCSPGCATITQPRKEIIGALTKAFNSHPGAPDIAFNSQTRMFDPVWGKSSVVLEMVHRVSLLEEAEEHLKALTDFLLNNVKGSQLPLVSKLRMDNQDILAIMDMVHAFKEERCQAQTMLEHLREGGCIPHCNAACAKHLTSNRNALIVQARKIIQKVFRKLSGCNCEVVCHSNFAPTG